MKSTQSKNLKPNIKNANKSLQYWYSSSGITYSQRKYIIITMAKSQELIVKKIEELCARLIKNYEEWHKEEAKWGEKVNEKFGHAPIDKEIENEGKRIKEKYLKKKNEIYGEIKDWILKDLTLWELDLEGNIQAVPGISVNMKGAGGGYILFGYKPDTNYIHFWGLDFHQEITQAFVEEIKQSPQDWEIILEEERNKPFIPKPMAANPKDCQVVKHKSGRRHNRGYQWYKDAKPGFSDEEWTEIENSLNSHKKIIPSKKDKKLEGIIESNNSDSQSSEKNSSNDKFPTTQLVRSGILAIIGLIVLFIWYLLRN